MRRTVLLLAVVAALLAAAIPSHAAPGGVVVSAGFRFAPGDNVVPVPTLRVRAGSDLGFLNLEALAAHSVTSDGFKPTGGRLFDSGLQNVGAFVFVPGISGLAVGSYAFHCSNHSAMHGTLVVF